MAGPEFRTLVPDAIGYGRVDQVTPGIRRVIAENPSKFTYLGTGTYIVGHGDVVVIDPGPELDSHRDALGAAIEGERVRAILVTHCHSDHSPLAEWLRDVTGAPTLAYGPHPRPETPARAEVPENGDDGDDDDTMIEESTDFDFAPTEVVADGEVAELAPGVTVEAVHTPGHTSNHMCWSFAEESVLFSGDHVMGWSTTVVSPPDGDMAEYIESLRRVAGRDHATLWPTHGPPRDDVRPYVESLVEHRLQRERDVLAAVRDGHGTIADIVGLLYADVRAELHKPAGRSVWAHLAKLVGDGEVAVDTGEAPALDSIYRAA